MSNNFKASGSRQQNITTNNDILVSNNNENLQQINQWKEMSEKLNGITQGVLASQETLNGRKNFKEHKKYIGTRILRPRPSGTTYGSSMNEKELLAHTLNNTNITSMEACKGMYPNVTRDNYNNYITSMDSDNIKKGIITESIVKAKLPFSINVARLNDDGKEFLQGWNFKLFILSRYQIYNTLYRGKNIEGVNSPKNYPRYIVNFSPIIYGIKFNDTILWLKLSVNKTSGIKKSEIKLEFSNNLGNFMTEKGNLVSNANEITTQESADEYIKNKIETILTESKINNNVDIEGFMNFLNISKELVSDINTNYGGERGPLLVDMDNPNVFRAIFNDLNHDFKSKNNKKNNIENEKVFFDKLYVEFKSINSSFTKTINTNTNNHGKIPKATKSQNILINKSNEGKFPLMIKTLGDLSQIMSCIIKGHFFASIDSSAVNMAIHVSNNLIHAKPIIFILKNDPSLNLHKKSLPLPLNIMYFNDTTNKIFYINKWLLKTNPVKNLKMITNVNNSVKIVGNNNSRNSCGKKKFGMKQGTRILGLDKFDDFAIVNPYYGDDSKLTNNNIENLKGKTFRQQFNSLTLSKRKSLIGHLSASEAGSASKRSSAIKRSSASKAKSASKPGNVNKGKSTIKRSPASNTGNGKNLMQLFSSITLGK